MLHDFLKQITPPHALSMRAAQEKWDKVAKPLNSLGRLEEMVIQLAGIEGTSQPIQRKKAVIMFCADNGIIAEGVTQSGSEVTAAVARNFAKGIATVNVFARTCGADTFPVDIGMAEHVVCDGLDVRKVCCGTRNFAKEPAMTRHQAEQAILTGINLVQEKKEAGYNLIITGEMGIGNTSTSSAVLSVLLEKDAAEVTGRGAGLSDEALNRKTEIIRNAIALHQPNKNDILDVLSKVGGLDICGMTGAFLGGAIYRVPVLIDGLISAVAAICAVRLAPLCRHYMYASHCSAEPAGKLALQAIGKQAYLDCGMCLGEGTGGVIGAKLFDFALAAYQEAAKFSEASVEQYVPQK